MATYLEKLKDPRWQKVRLEILQRDNWSCKVCGDKETTLHVHHKKYNGDPWEADPWDLMTLCENCHGMEELCKKEFIKDAHRWVSVSDFSFEYINSFLRFLEKATLYHKDWKLLQAIEFVLNSESAQNILIHTYELSKESKAHGERSCRLENGLPEPENVF